MSALLDLKTVRELALLEVGPGDSFLPHFLEAFAADAGATLERLRERLRAGDGRELAREVHRLRGASASIGAAQLARELAEIELGARHGSLAVMEARLAHALNVLYSTCDAILHLCHRPPHEARSAAGKPSSPKRAAGAP